MNALLLSVAVLVSHSAFAQPEMTRVEIVHISKDLRVADFHQKAWRQARPIHVTKYWSGDAAPMERTFEVRLLWSADTLFVRFYAEQHEPIVIRDHPDTSKKVRGLWDYDVCEIFIAPDRTSAYKYLEFEVAPTGEWIDLGIEVTPKERLTDWEYTSGMEAAADIEHGKVIEIIKVPFKAFGRTPKPGDIWLGNIFRCIGKDPSRGYLAWRPTRTEKPAFHVPEAFGEFQFVGGANR